MFHLQSIKDLYLHALRKKIEYYIDIIIINISIMKSTSKTAEITQQSSEQHIMKAYLDSLAEKEKKGYEIAKSHLGMSFQLEKSLGYLQYKKSLENP